MSKKHPERARRRRQARAAKHRHDCAQRKAAVRARKLGVPRKSHAARGEAEPGEGVVIHVPETAEGLAYRPLHVEPPAEPPPPPRVVEVFRGALEAVLGGGGEAALVEVEWVPAAEKDDEAQVLVALRLFGQAVEIDGSIFSLDGCRFPELDAVEMRAAAQVVTALRQDRASAVAAILLYGLDELLVDALQLNATQVADVLERLGVPRDLEDILEPLAQRLPAAERRAWDAACDEGRWDETIGQAVFQAIVWDADGPLADFGAWIAAAVRQGWDPPWVVG
jgi:hypothetical protein